MSSLPTVQVLPKWARRTILGIAVIPMYIVLGIFFDLTKCRQEHVSPSGRISLVLRESQPILPFKGIKFDAEVSEPGYRARYRLDIVDLSSDVQVERVEWVTDESVVRVFVRSYNEPYTLSLRERMVTPPKDMTRSWAGETKPVD